jgi:hypothetical protein
MRSGIGDVRGATNPPGWPGSPGYADGRGGRAGTSVLDPVSVLPPAAGAVVCPGKDEVHPCGEDGLLGLVGMPTPENPVAGCVEAGAWPGGAKPGDAKLPGDGTGLGACPDPGVYPGIPSMGVELA